MQGMEAQCHGGQLASPSTDLPDANASTFSVSDETVGNLTRKTRSCRCYVPAILASSAYVARHLHGGLLPQLEFKLWIIALVAHALPAFGRESATRGG